jgi:hypothetical protein
LLEFRLLELIVELLDMVEFIFKVMDGFTKISDCVVLVSCAADILHGIT